VVLSDSDYWLLRVTVISESNVKLLFTAFYSIFHQKCVTNRVVMYLLLCVHISVLLLWSQS